MAVFGLYRWAFFVTVSAFICRKADTSRIHKLRPCVAATISPAVGCTAISCTATVGKLLLILVHDSPRLSDTNTLNSVPQYKRSGFSTSSRRQRVEPTGGRLLEM